ncbi:MAG: hypothetical protein U0271_24120 [Polyangiaceae bacterium]
MANAVVHVSDRLCIAECQSIAINFWRGIPHRADWQEAVRHLGSLHRRFPAGIFALVVFPLPPTLSIREIEFDRKEMEIVARQFVALGRGCASVIEGSGFVGATVRSVVSGLTLITRPPFPSRIFDSVTEAIHWLAPQVMPRPTPSFMRELDLAVTSAREATRMVPPRAAAGGAS